MNIIYKDCIIIEKEKRKLVDIEVHDGYIYSIFEKKSFLENVFDKYCILPGLTDVHVHLREPGFFYKETIKTGTESAARGGFTAVCTMPNLKPVPDTVENMKIQKDIIEENAVIPVYPYASITIEEKGETLVDFEALRKETVAFSDDGKGVQSDERMKEAMRKVKALNGMIVAHCEDETLSLDGYIHDGEYAKKNNHKGICSASEWKHVERDINLVRETGVRYHICHVSTKESVELVRQAKKEGLPVTCETAPHYLWYVHDDLKEEGKYKMNPPLRDIEDQRALIEGLRDGTVDVIATDHAPHSQEEKSKGLKDSAFGIVGLETSFGAVYTKLVKEEGFELEKIIEIMSEKPRKIFDLPKAEIKVGAKADFFLVNLEEEWEVRPEEFASMGRATPFEGKKLFGKVKETVYGDVKFSERI